MYYTKKHYPFHGLFLLFAGLSLLGCTDEDNSYAPAHPGNAIQFSVERIATRTHYEDKYEENGKVYYPIDWDTGDRIFISSTDAVPGTSISDQRHAIYKVTPTDDALYHGSIVPIDPSTSSENDAYGLHWGMGDNFDKPYTFYGAYPAQRVKGYSNSMEDMTSGTLTMQYYTNQVCKITSVENGQYESEPDMMNAYMLAKKTLPSPTADHILLDFKPIMTTLDIHITAGNYEVATGIIQPVTITGVSIITPGELTGKELQCNAQTLDKNGTTTLTNFNSSSQSKECVFVGIDNALKGSSIGCVDLFEDESLHLMAFLPPFENVSDGTQIKIHAVGGLSFEFTLKEGQNYFEAQKRIDVQLPDVSPVTTKTNDWISQLNGSKLLKTLSIPGYECKKGDESKLNDLLNMGVRAFDMDLMKERSGSVCRFSDSITQTLKNFLSTNPNEFVIIWIHNSALNLRLNEYLDEKFPNQWVSPENIENLTIAEAANTPIIVVKKNTSYKGEFNRESEHPLFSRTVLFTMSDFTNGTLDLSEEWGVHPISDVAMNKSIYEQITSSDKQEGFTGIVMVYNAGEIYADDTYTYSDLLIQSIIDCNFKLH